AEPWDDPVATAADLAEDRTLTLGAQPAPLYHGETARVLDDLRRLVHDGLKVVLVFEAHGPAERALEVLREADLGARLVDEVTTDKGVIEITTGGLNHGFLDETARLAVITGNDITGGRGTSTRDMRKMPSRRRNTINPLE